MSDIRIDSLTISVNGKSILKDFSFYAEDHAVTGILAPSGFGKTTFLNWMAGLLDEKFDFPPVPDFGKIACVFQEPRLIPNLTVAENVSLPLRKMFGKKMSVVKAEETLEKVCMLSKKIFYPSALSGGEAQRVAIARAFAFSSDLMLLDEPLNSLDKKMKFLILQNLKDFLAQNPRTVIFVSHDEEELDFLCKNIQRF